MVEGVDLAVWVGDRRTDLGTPVLEHQHVLDVGPNGEGEGTMSVATRALVNETTKRIELEHWGISPVALQSVTLDN